MQLDGCLLCAEQVRNSQHWQVFFCVREAFKGYACFILFHMEGLHEDIVLLEAPYLSPVQKEDFPSASILFDPVWLPRFAKS